MERQGVKKGDIWGQDGCKAMTDMETQEVNLVLCIRVYDLISFSQQLYGANYIIPIS